jgi:hypothetical protein
MCCHIFPPERSTSLLLAPSVCQIGLDCRICPSDVFWCRAQSKLNLRGSLIGR